MEYNITLFSFPFVLSFSPHARKQARKRNVSISAVIDSLKTAEDVIADNIKDGQVFILINRIENLTTVINFHFDWIDVITVWNGVNFKIARGESVIEISQENNVKYFKFGLTDLEKCCII
jgi:hypothetical protein